MASATLAIAGVRYLPLGAAMVPFVLFAVPVVGALNIVVRKVLAARAEHRRAVAAAGEPMVQHATPPLETPERHPPH